MSSGFNSVQFTSQEILLNQTFRQLSSSVVGNAVWVCGGCKVNGVTGDDEVGDVTGDDVWWCMNNNMICGNV